MRMHSLILYVISCYGVYKCVCFCTMISWCSVKASAAIQNSPRSPRNVTEHGECWRRHIDHLRVRYQSLLSEQSLLEEGPAMMEE